MNAEERMGMVLKAGKPVLARIDAILLGRDEGAAAPRSEIRNFATYNITRTAELLNVSRKTVYRMINEKVIPAISNGHSKRISHEAIAAYLTTKA